MRFSTTALASLLPLVSGCLSVQEALDAPEPVVLPTEGSELGFDIRSGVPEHLVPLLDAIRIALDNGDDLSARRSLALLFQRKPSGRTLELAEGFERILDGRQCIRWLDLRLEALEIPDVSGTFRLELVISQDGPEDLRLRTGGARLHVMQYAVDPDGREQRGTRRDGVIFPDDLLIPTGGASQRLELAKLELNIPKGILAFSSQFTLEFLPGECVTPDGRYLPVQNIPSPQIELVRLGQVLPTARIEPEELVSYVEQGRIYVPALMERAVRIPPELRQRTLDLLTPTVEEMNVVELELLVPALRWLARTTRPGGSPDAWRAWMAHRHRRALKRAEPDWEGIHLPPR